MLAVHHVAHLARVDEERPAFLFFALGDEPERYGNGDAVKKLRGHGDDAFDQIGFDDFPADFSFAARLRGKRAVREHQPDFAVRREVVDHVLNPCVVRVACGRNAIVPARVALKLVLPPVGKVERRVCHDEVEFLVGMQVAEKGVLVVVAEVRVDSADRHVHLRHFPCVGVGFLPEHADVVPVPRVFLDELHRLDEHAARTAARVVHALSFGGLEYAHDCLYHACGRVEFAALYAFVACELRDAVFVGAAEQVFARLRVAHVHVGEHVHHVAEHALVQFRACVVLGEDTFEAFVVGFDRLHRVVDDRADFGRVGCPRDVLPAGFLRNEEDVFRSVSVGIVLESIAFRDKFVMFLFERRRNVLEENESRKYFAVVRRRNVPPQFAGGIPNLLLKTERCGIGLFWFGHVFAPFLHFAIKL